eukprot:scaffold124500_cov58-Phaeocystis_antarctica.AAC.2
MGTAVLTHRPDGAGSANTVVPPDRCIVAPSGAAFSLSTVWLARITLPAVTCRPPPCSVAELRSMREATTVTSVRLPVTARAPPFAATLPTRTLLDRSNLLPEEAATAPPKLASKRLLRIAESPPLACSARVP